MGNLDKVWLVGPDEVAAEEFQAAFEDYFGAKWVEVLDAMDKSLAYNMANNVYFAVRDLRHLENLTLEQLLTEQGIGQAPNIIVG